MKFPFFWIEHFFFVVDKNIIFPVFKKESMPAQISVAKTIDDDKQTLGTAPTAIFDAVPTTNATTDNKQVATHSIVQIESAVIQSEKKKHHSSAEKEEKKLKRKEEKKQRKLEKLQRKESKKRKTKHSEDSPTETNGNNKNTNKNNSAEESDDGKKELLSVEFLN